ncbi:hypothetical protein Bbelb_063400 [Branchiostoma belcheri]|nr:hypothetical protein Bbelb_063400 [Branchiostoma belcheri]
MATSAIMQQEFDFPRAFNHNRIFKTKKNDVTGCHDLRYLLEAQSKGLVVAAVVKLPTDDLPDGVYKILLTCRSDVQLPNNDPRRKQKREEQPQGVSNIQPCGKESDVHHATASVSNLVPGVR